MIEEQPVDRLTRPPCEQVIVPAIKLCKTQDGEGKCRCRETRAGTRREQPSKTQQGQGRKEREGKEGVVQQTDRLGQFLGKSVMADFEAFRPLRSTLAKSGMHAEKIFGTQAHVLQTSLLSKGSNRRSRPEPLPQSRPR
mmetsp:Transcript_4235/g.8868  ORF Transcript_4235/g.8868 Transcript_4235/m.8868 type:complete len:139 (+) Transcript_4235:1989-2405(+)